MTRRSKSSADGTPDAPGRNRRVGALIRRELSEIINHELNDPNVGMVTITGVDVSPDLKYASVFVNHLTGDETQSLRSIGALTHATGFLRRQLARRLTQRVTPALTFKYDDSIETGMRISKLIDSAIEDSVVDDEEDSSELGNNSNENESGSQ